LYIIRGWYNRSVPEVPSELSLTPPQEKIHVRRIQNTRIVNQQGRNIFSGQDNDHSEVGTGRQPKP
jgi:hypothetical protein